MVSMATYNAFLKNGDIPTKVLISQQQLIRNFQTWYQLNVKNMIFIQCSDMQIIKFAYS